jgi:lysophospholipase L1-like esterase
MSEQTSPQNRLGAVAAYTGGALTAASALGFGLLFGQVLIARLTIPGAEEPPPRSSGDYGTQFAGARPLRLAVIGDSTAAGYGVHTRAETPGALLSTWIAEKARRPVRLTCPAVVGSVSEWLDAQSDIAIEAGVDLAIIFIGANDVTTRVSDSVAVAYLYEAVTKLRHAGAEVVVATCPDLGTVRPIQPPLRWLARRWSRQLAAAQTVAAVRAGARTVSLGDLVGPQFAAAPERMFGADRYHPSDEGYRAASGAVLPAALAALGLRTDDENLQTAAARLELEDVAPVALTDAAVAAVREPGTEVSVQDGVRAPAGGMRRLRPPARFGRWVRAHIPGLSRAATTNARRFAVPSLAGASASPAAVVAPSTPD